MHLKNAFLCALALFVLTAALPSAPGLRAGYTLAEEPLLPSDSKPEKPIESTPAPGPISTPAAGNSSGAPTSSASESAPPSGADSEKPLPSAAPSTAPEAGVPSESPASASPSASPEASPSANPSPESGSLPEASPSPESPVAPEPSSAANGPLLEDLAASKDRYVSGETLSWTFSCRNAESLSYEIVGVRSGRVAGGSLTTERKISYLAAVADSYTLTLVAQAGGQSASASSTVLVAEGEWSASLSVGRPYAVAHKKAIGCRVEIGGGTAPYTVQIQIALGKQPVYEQTSSLETNAAEISYMPTAFGVHTVSVTVTDASGGIARASADIPVAVLERETPAAWERSVQSADLTGDWREDFIAVARTQLGYAESTRDFVIAENGSVQGYTRYGHWYGAPYGEWCAMFVSFCLHYAQIPEDWVPRAANCERWREALSSLDAYKGQEEGYAPEPGDLIFFRNEDGKIYHVGIVERVSETAVHTIEGNRGKSVRRCDYDLENPGIAGYGDMRALMERAAQDPLQSAGESARPAQAPSAGEPDGAQRAA